MREVSKILAYAIATLLVGCVLAPPLYWLGRWAVESGLLPSIAKFGFAKYFNRAVLVAAVLLLWPCLRLLGVRRFSDLGLAKNPSRFLHLGLGFALGMAGLVFLGICLLASGGAEWRNTPRWDKVPGSFLTAITVALIEETLFRGALLGVLRRSLSWPVALGFLSALFAGLHFIKQPKGFAVTEVDMLSGFRLFPHIFWQYGEPQLLVGGLLTIFLLALTLGYSVVVTRSLFFAIGLHAGLVSALRSFTSLTRRPGAPNLWFGEDLIVGLAPVLLLVAIFAILVLLARPGRLLGTPVLSAPPEDARTAA